MWCGSGISKDEHQKVIEENIDLHALVKYLEAKVKDLEYQLDKVKSNIYFDKFHYNENDLVQDRRCFIPRDEDLRRIVLINGSWEVVREINGKYDTPEVFVEYKKKLNKDKLSKKELLDYMKDKMYIMEQGGYSDDPTGVKV